MRYVAFLVFHMKCSVFSLCFLAGWIGHSGYFARADESAGVAVDSRFSSRIVKQFDFDERRLGNYDPMPMGWRQIIEPGYPRFLDATFDESVGHGAPPSFHMPLRGGNLGAAFSIREIEVDPRCAYRVVGWVRPKKLSRAGAFMTASYLGQNMKLMPGTERRSKIVRGNGTDEGWVCVAIDLPDGVQHARWLSISCRVEQETVDEKAERSYTSIEYHDATGEAWFDDISIIRMPKAMLTLSDPQGVFENGARPVVRVKLDDSNGDGLTVELELLDADGRRILRKMIDAAEAVKRDIEIAPDALPPGAYSVSLRIRSGESLLSQIDRRFVCLGRDSQKHSTGDSGFGIVLDGSAVRDSRATQRFVHLLRPDLVKVPVWRSDLTDETVLHGAADFERMVKALHDQGVGLVGSLVCAPKSLAEQYPRGRRGLFDILSSEAALWRPYLALVVTRYGSWMQYWQLGPDRANSADASELSAQAVRNTANEMRPLIGKSRIVVPQSSDWSIDRSISNGDVVSLVAPEGRPASQFVNQLEGAQSKGGGFTWATIRSLDANRYSRIERLADYARGLLLARCHGINTVFTDMPWRAHEGIDGNHVEPTEELILLRTLGTELAGLMPKRKVRLGPETEAWLFANDTETRGVLVAWACGAAEDSTAVAFDFGDDVGIVNLWGVRSTCSRSLEGNTFRLGTMPVMVTGINPRRVAIVASLELDLPLLPPTIEDHDRVLRLSNSSSSRLRGPLRFVVPHGWHIRPGQTIIDLEPGASASIPVRIRLPANQAVGDFEMVGRLKADGGESDEWVLRAPVAVESAGLDVDVAAFRDGDRVRVIQRVTNRTEGELDLKASMISPDLPREWRTISRLGAGESAIRKYEIPGGAALRGRAVRVSVEQVGGGVRHNALVVLE